MKGVEGGRWSVLRRDGERSRERKVREVETGWRDARLEGYLIEFLHGAFGFLAVPPLLDLALPLAHSTCQ